MRRSVLMAALVVACASVSAAQATAERPGILLLAHGGSPAWDANVHTIAADVNRTMPTEVALGMATRANIQLAIERLEARGVTSIVAVPMFVSSHSSVITSTEYLLGVRTEMPAALKVFATMSHGSGGHEGHAIPQVDGTRPVKTRLPIRVSPALDAHPLVGDILIARADAISKSPEREAVLLVAHGPNDDDVNERWLVNLRTLGKQIAHARAFAAVDAITVRDDAPAPIRDAAARDLRALVTKHREAGRTVLIVPVLLSYGGIEGGIRERLAGLAYAMSAAALAPDPRLADWVRAMAKR